MNKSLLLSGVLVLTLAACDNKSEPPAQPVVAAPEAAPKAREAAPKAAEPAPKAAAGVLTPTAVKEASAATSKAADRKPAANAKNEVEQDLAATAEHARTVTRTQESKARTRAQKAEDEMMESTRQK